MSKQEIWKVYGYWAFWVGVAFFSVYPACNWFTSQRIVTYPLFLDVELYIPLVPEFFWLYVSMYVLFLLPPFFLNSAQLNQLGKQLIMATIVTGIIFLLVPTELGFERINPEDQFYSVVFTQLFTVDLPHNLVPSLHVVFSAIIVFALLEGMTNFGSKLLLWVWLILLCLSTLLVHQHHLLDVITGLLIASIFNNFYKKRGKPCLNT